MSPFAVFYFAAQAVERVTEVFSKIGDIAGKDEKDREKQPYFLLTRDWRAIWLWIVASALGIGLAFGIQLDLVKASGTAINQTVDQILTGIIIGAGTKPLHDLISYVQKASTKKGKDS